MKITGCGVLTDQDALLFEAKWRAVQDALDKRALTSLARVAANCRSEVISFTQGLDSPKAAKLAEWAANLSGELLEDLFLLLRDFPEPK